MSNTELLSGAPLRSIDAVIHCAFPWRRGGVEMGRGLEFHQKLLMGARDAGVPTLVHVSSQSVYARDRVRPAREGDDVDLDSPYSTAKYALELFSTSVLGSHVCVNARVGSLIGVGYDVRLVNRFIRRALGGQPIEVRGGRQVVDFTDVRDAAAALRLIGEQGSRGHEVVNVGAGQPLTLLELARVVVEEVEGVVGRRLPVTVDTRTDEYMSSALCNRVLAETYRFQPSHTLRDSVRWILHSVLGETTTSDNPKRDTGDEMGHKR